VTIVDPDTTAATVTAPPAERATRRDPLSRLPSSVRFAVYGSLLILVLTTAEQLTDQGRLTSTNTWSSALQLTMPIALAGLGGLWAERAGVVNIGLEGMMILGTWVGAWGCIEFGPWAGVALGVLGGALGGLLHAIATVGFGVDHIVSGVAINILGAGATQFLNLEAFDSTNQSPTIPSNVGRIRIPGLNDLVGGVTGNLTDSSVLVWLAVTVGLLVVVVLRFRPGGSATDPEGWRELAVDRPDRATPPLPSAARPILLWALGIVVGLCLIELAPYLDEQERFFISELGRIIEGLTDDLSVVVVLGVLAFPVSAFVLWRTKFGLRLRSVGEDPVAAETLGVNVYLMKFVAVITSGAMAGLGGVTLVYVFAQKFQTGQTNGRGYIGLAAMIFGNWRPGGLALGAGLFGFTDALSLQSGETTRALLVVVALGSVVMVARALVTGRWKPAVVAVVAGVASYGWFRAVDELPGEIVVFLPHLTTLLVLTFASQRLRPPAADGQRYRRGESG
jgi:simple sugar transport system permease protein